MKVFGHHPVTDYDEAILFEGALQDAQEQVTATGVVKPGTALVTTAGDEMEIVPTIPALQTPGHASNLSRADGSRL
jgi:hypothetical protein